MSEVSSDIVIVGAGPAGLAAACVAAESGSRVTLLDETPWLGGQIWRGKTASADRSGAASWLERLRRSGAQVLDRTSVFGCPEPGLLLAEAEGQSRKVRWKRLVIATGARELFLPFPGWTLPGVMGAGGLLNLAKTGWPVNGRRIVVAGSGPLLLAAAEGLARRGGRVVAVIEQAPLGQVARFALGLYRHPSKLWQGFVLRLGLMGIPFQFGAWPIKVTGGDQVRSVSFSDGRRTWSVDCDLLACGFGLVPNVELAVVLGCALEQGFVRVDDYQCTSAPGIYCAGEPTGIAGADAALVQGQIAGFAASDRLDGAQTLLSQRARWASFGEALARSFALRPELKSLAADDTMVCRCEDVSLGRLRQFSGWREAKLQTRCGMGPCQGRVCGPATEVILGWSPGSVRPPILPARVTSLISDT
jgi:D-hydroxyproline dehydrogenase subunit alpha